MPATPITDHVDQGLGKLIQRFKGRPRFASWCASHLKQAQLLEDACWKFLNSIDIDTADMPRLTLLGKIVGQPVVGSLEQFRLYVKVRVLVNRSSGTAPNLIKIARILLGDIYFRTYQPARIVIEAQTALAGRDPVYSVLLLREAKLAGVALNLVAQTQTDAFMPCAGGTPLVDAAHGLARVDLSTGGYLAGVW
jgi:hypothetical protein